MFDASQPSAPLTLDGVWLTLPSAAGPVEILRGLDFTVATGERVAVVGPSGSGKSTLIAVAAGLERPTRGRVRLLGQDLARLDEDGRAKLRRGRVSLVFQAFHLLPNMTALENVAAPLEIAGMAKPERLERARHFISLVGLDGFERRYPSELSGGMRQRVSMARTLAAQPKIMLMDEPFAALDEQTRLLLGDKVLQIQQTLKQTTLLITHNITEAVQLSDRILVMTYRPGRVKRIVDIDLPRPRTSEIVSSDAFGRYVAQIWADLREEASRGMQDDESRKLHAGETA